MNERVLSKHKQATYYSERALELLAENNKKDAARFLKQAICLDQEILDEFPEDPYNFLVLRQMDVLTEAYQAVLPQAEKTV